MKKKSMTVFFALSLIVVLVAAGAVVFRIAASGVSGRAMARTQFAELTAILAPVRTASDMEDPTLRTRLAAYYRRSPNILLVSVYERGGGVRWRIPATSEYLPAKENLAPIPQPNYPDRSAILLAATLPADISGRLAVDALYVTLPQGSVFLAFRDACLGIAAWLVFIGVFFLIASMGKDRAESESDTAEADFPTSAGANPPQDGFAARTIPAAKAGANPTADEGDSPIGETAPSADGIVYAEPEEDYFDIPALSEGTFTLEAEMPKKPYAEDAESVELQLPVEEPPVEEMPGGLYSPLSGLGWESYLADRLDSELARSASFEQDLSLLFVAYEGLSPEKAEYKVVARSLSDFFSFKDLAFEHGPEGFAVILPNVDADHSLRMAEEFLKKLTFLLAKDKPLSYIPVFIGISSRSGRLVDGARIGQEARAALQRARDERDSHIIAFKPDPDRYRIYLASKGL